MTKASLSLIVIWSLAALASPDSQFEDLGNRYVAEYLAMNPEAATLLGEHKYDHRLNDYSLKGVAKSRAMNQKYSDELSKISFEKLSRVNNVDARILRENLEYALFETDVLRSYEWNPLSYNPGDAINNLIARDFAPLKERLANVKQRLEQIPSVVAAAKTNLKNPPRVYTQTATDQNKGVISLIRDDVQMWADKAGMKSDIASATTTALTALEEYGNWLEKDLLPRSTGDFRLGEDKFKRKLKFALSSDLSKEEILKRAEADLKATQDRMFLIAQQLQGKGAVSAGDKKGLIKAVLDKLAEQRPNNDTIVGEATKDLKQTTDFVRERGFVTVPTEPVKVIVMPEYARGTAIAFFDSAGPFEKKNESFYAISPTPKDWTAQRSESFYKEYNDYMLQDLTIHEAMPGHYLQIMHSNHFKAPTMIRALFSSGSFVEGWAVYGEQVMAEMGYGGPKVELQQLKMKLRVITNAIIDQKIHTQGMTEKEAIDFMMSEGFQEEGEAVGKWKRAQLSSTQLSTYYVGLSEMNDIRKAYEAKHPGKVNLKTMHDEMLSFGSPPAKYVKELMGL